MIMYDILGLESKESKLKTLLLWILPEASDLYKRADFYHFWFEPRNLSLLGYQSFIGGRLFVSRKKTCSNHG